MTETISAENIAHAVNVANDLRREFDVEPIEDLPPGVPGNRRHCVLAKAFNFKCEIIIDNGTWYAKFKRPWEAISQSYNGNSAQAKKLATLLETEVIPYGSTNRVKLPPEIALIARAFDERILPKKYYDLEAGVVL